MDGRALEGNRLDSDGTGSKGVYPDGGGPSEVGRLGCDIEGLGKSSADGSLVHSALAFVSYDERAQKYRWRAFTAEGRQTDTETKVETDRLEWGFEMPPRGRVRYTLKRSEKDEWSEIGEMTQD